MTRSLITDHHDVRLSHGVHLVLRRVGCLREEDIHRRRQDQAGASPFLEELVDPGREAMLRLWWGTDGAALMFHATPWINSHLSSSGQVL